MNHIEQAIKEANDAVGSQWHEAHWEEALLDPLFWQALGKARSEIDAAWPNGEMRCENKFGRCEARYCEYGGYKNPKYRAMQFFDWVMDGKDAESFFADLIK